jgi:DNA invertase Pin-like site-specific DNA recombinase
MVLPQLAMYAEQEYHKIKERMQRGLRYAFEKNKDRYFGENIAYGFKLKSIENKNYLVVDEVEKTVIEDIFDKYINEGWSFRKIADYLNNKKIPTKDNKLWIDSNISRIVSNKRLIGIRNRSNMTVDSTPIIDEDIYNQAQQVLEDKKLIYGRKERTHNYPLIPMFLAIIVN